MSANSLSNLQAKKAAVFRPIQYLTTQRKGWEADYKAAKHA